MKRKALILVSLVAGLCTSSCNRSKTGGGPPKFADCDQDVEVNWAGKDMCAQEIDPTHWNTPGVKIVSSKCRGIHISHTKDFRLDVLLRKENATKSCPLQPFKTSFPVHSGKDHVKEFHTGPVSDAAAIGCEYEVRLTEVDNPGTCDPHVDITDGGTP